MTVGLTRRAMLGGAFALIAGRPAAAQSSNFQPVTRITVRHGFFDGAPVPARVAFAGDARTRLSLAFDDAGTVILAPDGLVRPGQVVFSLTLEDTQLAAFTSLGGAPVGPGPAGLAPAEDGVLRLSADRDAGARGIEAPGALAVFSLDLNAAPDEITVSLDPVASRWDYLILPRPGVRYTALGILDPSGRVAFQNLGPTTLPSGITAIRVRALTPLPLRARYDHRFILTHEVDGARRILVSDLPHASLQSTRVDGDTIRSEMLVGL